MNVAVFETQEAVPRDSKPDLAVVIDVLRATSVMVTAVARGAQGIWPVDDEEEARRLKQEMGEDPFLLVGERRSLPPPGFDLGNSPLPFSRGVGRGRKLIVCTTNGTRAIRLLKDSRRLLLGSLLNKTAVASHILRGVRRGEVGRVWIVCAGTEGRFSLEDFLCAGAIASACRTLSENASHSPSSGRPWQVNDQAVAAMAFWRQHEGAVADVLLSSFHGRRLCQLGFAEDVRFCAQVDRFPVNVRLQSDHRGRPVLIKEDNP